MSNEMIKTDFAIFRLNAEKGCLHKEYLPSFEFLAENDFQNSRNFEDEAPFFIPQNSSLDFPLKKLQSLSDWQKNSLNDEATYTHKCFQISSKLIEALKKIHQKKRICGCLTPNNILIDEQDNVWFSEWSFDSNNKINNSLFLSTSLLNYIAPEQTNRNQKLLSFQTDLYALGVVLFELFAKNNPFSSQNELDTIHRHRTFIPTFPTGSGVAMGQLVLKLLEKDPAKRFDSIAICAENFSLAQEYFNQKRFDEKIDLDKSNVPQFIFTQTLLEIYEDEIDTLKTIYDQTYQNKLGSVCLIEGKNGVQKSAIIDRFFHFIESENTLTVSISLKNDQQTPLSSFRELLKTITQYYLTRPESELLNFQNIVLSRLGIAYEILHEIYPRIEQIIPRSTENPHPTGFELRSQLIFALAEFLKSFVQSQKKILVHFRGFQFTTNNTLAIIEGILKELPLENLIFLISYESELLDENQQKIIQKLQNDDSNLLNIRQLDIYPYQLHQLENKLINANVNPSETKFVAEILWAKSNGMTNFLALIIQDLVQKSKIYWSEKNNYWKFEKESLLASTNFSENLSEYHQKLFSGYDDSQVKVLKIAAQIGDIFPKNVLEKVSEEPNFEAIFEFIVANNLIKITSNDHDFVFIDNEIRNYCIGLTTSSEATEIKIIEAYLELYPKIEETDYFYSFLNKILQLPNAISYKKWIEKGLEFAHKIADFDIGFACSKKVVEMLTKSDWSDNQPVAFLMMVNYMDACSYCLKFEEVKSVFAELSEKTQTEAQYLYLAWHFAEANLLSHSFNECIKICTTALRKVKISISEDPSLPRIIYSSIRMNMLMKGKDLTFFQNLPEITEEAELYKIRLLQVMVGIAFITNPKMIPELIYKQADFSMKNGFSLNLGICLACHAFLNINYQQKYSEAKYSYELAEAIAKILKDNRTEDVNHFLNAAFMQHWFQNFRITWQQLLDNFQHCRQTGYVNLAYYNAHYIASQAILSEENISLVKSKITEILPYMSANMPIYGNDTIIFTLRFFQEIGIKEDDYLTTYFKSETMQQIRERLHDKADKSTTVKHTYLHLCQFYLNFLQENYGADKVDVQFCEKVYLTQGKGYYQLHISYYFVALNYVKLDRGLDSFETKMIQKTLKILFSNAKINQENYEAKALFLEGLMEIRNKNHAVASLKLQNALEIAIRFEQSLTAALIARELGYLLRKLSLTHQSNECLKNAFFYFKKYGADALANKIIVQFPELETKQTQSLDLSQKIDLQSFINASTTISAEIKLEKLLEKMMNVLAENAGAELVYFILPNQNKFELIASKNKTGIATMQHTNLTETLIPISILLSVMRSRQLVLLENASKNPIYRNDSYIRANQTQSVLCLPVVKNSQTIGIIYFENNLTSNAFTPESTETLNLLASQIAVSFENSQLYDNMEKKVLERTNELLIEKEKSEKLLLNILPSEVAEELKELGHSEARLYNHVTVLFADFVGFTRLSEKLSPKELIDEVDEYFKAFDMIMEDFGLEKIKTIGDAYLSVCGLPNSVENHAIQAAKASKAIIDFINKKRIEKTANNRIYFDIRIGLHSGPVIAGIVGLKKFAYDIWGDTVNTAARMEQASEPNRINLSTTTFELIKSEFDCQYRGKIEAKNKGEIDMYFLE